MGLAVGIDLGTTNTVVGAVRDGVVATLPAAEGRRLIPSVVSFHPSGSVLVGHGAVLRRLNDPSATIWSVKRLIGRAWNSPEVESVRKTMPFDLREGDHFLGAEDPEGFCRQILRILRDPARADPLSRRGRDYVRSLDWELLGQKFLSAVECAAA